MVFWLYPVLCFFTIWNPLTLGHMQSIAPPRFCVKSRPLDLVLVKYTITTINIIILLVLDMGI